MIGKEISEKFGYKIGLALGKYFRQGRVLIGRDPRSGADRISQAVISGLNRAGIKTKDLGIVCTPELTWYQVKRGYDLGISITGSHLPWNMIGIIPTVQDGSGVYGKIGEKITKIYESL